MDSIVEPQAAIHVVMADYEHPSNGLLSVDEAMQLQTLAIQDLSFLLDMPSNVFWSTLLFNDESRSDILRFLDGYTEQQCIRGKCLTAIDDTVVGGERTIAWLVFRLMLRLTTPPEGCSVVGFAQKAVVATEWSADVWLDALLSNDIVTLPRLCSMTTVFANNAAQMTYRLEFLFANASGLLRDLQTALMVVLDKIHGIQRRLGKASKKAVTNDALKPQDQWLAMADAELAFLHEAMVVLDSLASAGGHSVCQGLVASQDTLLKTLLGAYDVSSIIHRALKQEDGPSVTSSTTISSFDSNLIKSSSFDTITDPPIACGLQLVLESTCRVKKTALSLLQHIMYTEFINPATSCIESSLFSDFERVMSRLCDVLAVLFDSSRLDGPAVFLETASLILDYEIEFGLGDEISRLVHMATASEVQLQCLDTRRIQYFATSLEELLTFSGNAETRRLQQQLRRSNVQNGSSDASATATHQEQVQTTAAHTERTLLISAVHDIFPELGDGFIEACLVALNDDQELVIMKILEDALPDHIKKLDRTLPRTFPIEQSNNSVVAYNPQPESQQTGNKSPPPTYDESMGSTVERRNIYNGDEFDVFKNPALLSDTTKVSHGKQRHMLTAEKVLDQDKSEFIRDAKDQIIRDVQTFDEDDAYDEEDVEEYVNIAVLDKTMSEIRIVDEQEVTDGPSDTTANHEAYLVSIYTTDPSVFDIQQRKCKLRQQMCEATGLTHEQIEGWFQVLQRNPRKDRILAKYEWQGNKVNELTEERSAGPVGSASQPKRGGMNGSRGRGKGRGANHNRKRGHDKKMARANAFQD